MFTDDTETLGTQAHILDVVATALAIAGYKILDSDKNIITIRYTTTDIGESDFEVKVDEMPG